VPAVKLRWRNSLRLTIGSLSVSSQIRKIAMPIAETMMVTVMKLELNQTSTMH
jgi:hypothetical protein